jgi:hypothetical protein
MARTIATWVFGLLASAIIGSLVGTLAGAIIESLIATRTGVAYPMFGKGGWDFEGAFGGMSAFACLRL